MAVGWDEIAADGITNCGLSGGTRYCWGGGYHGLLGDDAVDNVYGPATVSGETIPWTHLSIGSNVACGITATDLYCWGDNDVGQLGHGDTGPTVLHPQEATAKAWTAIGVAFDGDSACALAGGQLSCWGENQYNMFGQGPNPPSQLSSPTPVMTTVSSWRQFSVGTCHVCAIEASTDALYCWGDNVGNELGDDELGNRVDNPRKIGVDTWKMVSAGSFHTCGVDTAGELFCWGSNRHGVIGDGSEAEPKPVRTVR
jgi:alpha-tubulin suppressor-like RCC1 family protein